MKHKLFGLTHPTWVHPNCFNYDTATEAEEAIRRVYGDNSGHLVVGVITPETP